MCETEMSRTKLREKDHAILELQQLVRSHERHAKVLGKVIADSDVAIEHHRQAMRGQTATINDQNEQLRCLKATIEVHLGTIKDQDQNISDSHALVAAKATEIANLEEEVEEQADVIRERDDTIEKYREDFRTMVEKIDELTPEEDDSPYEEPRPLEDMGARRGTEVTPRVRGKEGDHD